MNAQTLPDGWWRIGDSHKGHKKGKEDVIKEISEDEAIPKEFRAAITAEIAKLDCLAVEVHAHATANAGGFQLSLHIKKIF